jgi:hypothetical protein
MAWALRPTPHRGNADCDPNYPFRRRHAPQQRRCVAFAQEIRSLDYAKQPEDQDQDKKSAETDIHKNLPDLFLMLKLASDIPRSNRCGLVMNDFNALE